MKKLYTPFNNSEIEELKAGESVLITGELYVARDAAHKRIVENYTKTGKIVYDFKNQGIYYAGPCPNKPGKVIGSIGPTTSGRMDKYAPLLYDLGIKVTIGKGLRNDNVIDSITKNKGVYLGATGGAGALISKSIKSQVIIDFEDLGAEALRKITVEDFPAIVIIDSKGNNLYKGE